MDQQHQRSKTTHVAMIPSPGMGHVIPMIQLAKRLHRTHRVTTTLVVPTDGSLSKALKSVLSSLPSTISHVILPPASFEDIDVAGARIETLITLTVARSLPSLRRALEAITDLSALVVDLFATDAIDVAKDLHLPCHVFFASPASVLSLALHLPTLHASYPGEFRELSAVEIPGCIPMPGSELLEPLQDRKNDAYKWILHTATRYRLADGIMVNSFAELEPRAVEVLLGGRPKVYPVGPLVNIDPGAVVVDEWNCLSWLDQQPTCSVLFVSFGSGGTLGSAQVRELALGLEESEQRFLWVVRQPNDTAANATYFSANSNIDTSFDFLPEGFLERTRGRGLVVHSWAPQAQILAHVATGGFLTHCGWNSTLESVVNGVPLIAWPLFAEQKMNAFILIRDTKVALQLEKSRETGLVEKQEIAKVAKVLIEDDEGKELRNRMKDLKEAASKALTEEGLSSKALAEVVDQWNNHLNN